MEEGRTRTVLLGDARDGDRYLRATWHPESGTVVFSHWHGPVCAASTLVKLADAPGLVDLLVGALRQPAREGRADDTTVLSVSRPRAANRQRSGAYEGGE